jgi:CubicO group peptidase (beta-lactamase class C family)
MDTVALKSSADALLARAVKSGDLPGVVAAVTTRDSTVYEAAFGERVLGQGVPMTQDTVMWIASMTKPVTGVAAMQLVEQGRLDLDAPAAKVIPELGTVKVLEGWDGDKPRLREPKGAVTLRKLLTHTSGFVYDIWNPEMNRYLDAMNLPRAGSGRNIALTTPLAFDPGARWEYGIGIDWAGKMVEAASGKKLGAYMKEHIFEPLGMLSTAYRITPSMRERLAKVHQREAGGGLAVTDFEVNQEPEFEPGGGGLYSTASDYLKFIRMILGKGLCSGRRLLKPETVELMSRNSMGDLRVTKLPGIRPSLSHDAEFFEGTPKTWGLTFMINEETAQTGRPAGSLAWAGLGNTYFWIDPKNGIGGVHMAQVLPFVDPRALANFYAFEKSVYGALD